MKKESGFTLADMIMTVAIASIVLTLSVPTLVNWIRTEEINSYTRKISEYIRLIRRDSRRWSTTCEINIKMLSFAQEGTGFNVDCNYVRNLDKNKNCTRIENKVDKDCRLDYVMPTLNKNVFQIVNRSFSTTPNGSISGEKSVMIIIGSRNYPYDSKLLNCLLIKAPSGLIIKGKYTTNLALSKNISGSSLSQAVSNSSCQVL